MKKIGLIVNPIAGMGGSVGLKGTDNLFQKARELGATPQSQERTLRALDVLKSVVGDIKIITASGDMGELVSRSRGFQTYVVSILNSSETTSADTRLIAQKLMKEEVDLILFAGGDGTARDVLQVIGESIPVVGIPAGVKIHSPVYAINPEKAGELTKRFIKGEIIRLKTEEVLDIDEEAYRQGSVKTNLFGYMKVPDDSRFMQCRKSGSPVTDEMAQKSIALRIIDGMIPDQYYLIGPGSTTRPIMEALSLNGTLLGVDVVCNKELIIRDAAERDILGTITNHPTKIIVTPIGGQGYIFGRGNQQLSSKVIRQIGVDNIIIVATQQKIHSLAGRPFIFDTGDIELDQLAQGYVRVITGYQQSIMYRIDS